MNEEHWLVDAIIETGKLFIATIALMVLVGIPVGGMFGIAILVDDYGGYMGLFFIPYFVLLVAACRYVERSK